MIGELGAIQRGLAEAGMELSGMIRSMDQGHRELVERRSAILGHTQFQDVIRQRLEHVGDAVSDLGDHVTDCIAVRRSGDCGARQTINQRMIDPEASHVMDSQRAVHTQVSGGSMPGTSAPGIELS